MIDSDQIPTFGPMGEKVWSMYERIASVIDIEMMEFTEEELQALSIIYGDNFVYPVYNHVNQLLTGAPEEEIIH